MNIDTTAQRYRDEAARMLEAAQHATEPAIKARLLEMAQSYLEMARGADATDARPASKPGTTTSS